MTELPKVAEEAVKKIDTKLECSICLDNFKEPKLLPCFHVFCKSPCLERLVVQGPEGQSLNCPTCRHVIPLPPTGVAGLQTDFHIEHLFEIKEALEKAKKGNQCQVCNDESTPAAKFCKQCHKLMCEKCSEIHEMWGEFKGHEITGIDVIDSDQEAAPLPAKPVATCRKHSQVEAKIYCETCSELICSDCTVSVHKDHTVSLIDDIFPRYKEELISGLGPLKEQQYQIQQALSTCDAKTQEIKNCKASIESSISLKFDELHQLLDQRKAILTVCLEEKTEEKLKELITHKDHMETMHMRVSSCVEYAESGLEAGVESTVVTMKTTVLRQIEQITTEFDLESLQPQTEADIELLNIDAADAACRELGDIVCDPVSAGNSHATGNGTTFAVANKQMSVKVHLVTARNKKCKEIVNVCAELDHVRNRALIRCDVQQEIGFCKISYKPVSRGKHSLRIKIHKQHIRGSPYPIAVTPSLESLHRPSRVIRGLTKPYGLTLNSKRQVVTIERFEHKQCVTVLTPAENKHQNLSIGSTRGAKNGQFNCPRNVAVDQDDNIYVADKDNHRIQKFTSEGKFVAAVGSRGNNNLQFAFPNGIYFHKLDRNLYVCDQQNNRIQVLSTDLNFVRCFGSEGEEPGQFKSPMCVSFDKANNIYVTDFGNNRVQVFTADGQFLKTFSEKASGERLQQPFAIAIDSSNIVYVSEWERNSVNLFTPEGKHVISFGASGTKEGQFNKVRGLYIDQHDSIFVSDHQNHRIQIF